MLKAIGASTEQDILGHISLKCNMGKNIKGLENSK